MTKRLLSVLFLAFFIVAGYSQMSLDKGEVKMEITDISSDNEQMAMQLEMMKGSQTSVYFDKDSYSSQMSMMGGMVNIKTYSNSGANTFDMLMDAMGQKMWVASSLDESVDNKEKEMTDKMKIEYDKDDVKEILGYKCYKVKVTNPEADANALSMSGYVTEDIKTNANIIQGLQTLKFEGFTLEFTVVNPMMSMTMTAIEVNKDFDSAKLVPVTEGFKKMTMDEFKASMGGLGGF